MQVGSKKELAVILSRLHAFSSPDVRLEQYMTDSELAAEILWSAQLNKDITGKDVADLGCGTGILGIGALLLGAVKVYFVDIDQGAIGVLRKNLEDLDLGGTIENCDVGKFDRRVDTVLQNPPFGVKKRHADRVFLTKAFEVADVVYSFHKLESEDFLRRFSEKEGFSMTHFYSMGLPLKKSYAFHTKKTKTVDAGCWRFAKYAGKDF